VRQVSKTETIAVMYTVNRKRKAEVQVGCPFGEQCSELKGSYGRKRDPDIRRTKRLVLMEQGLHSKLAERRRVNCSKPHLQCLSFRNELGGI